LVITLAGRVKFLLCLASRNIVFIVCGKRGLNL